MQEQFKHSAFYEVYFPPQKEKVKEVKSLRLHQTRRFSPKLSQRVCDVPWVVFDFETTGLNAKTHEIVEIGALRYLGNTVQDRFATLIKPERGLTYSTTKITGITAQMLADKPTLDEVIYKFLDFIKGAILIAHNADFDASFLEVGCQRHDVEVNCPVYCTLKMARTFLPELEKRTLDALASYYGFEFSARHRSIGDAEVTAAVFQKMFDTSSITLQDLEPYRVNRCN